MSVTKEELEKYNAAYMEGKPLISDEEYDRLQEEYVNEHGEQSRLYTRSQQTDSVGALVGTLPKVYGVTQTMRPEQHSYVHWVESKVWLKGVGIVSEPDKFTIIVQPKFDGCSVAYDAHTHQYFKRGDYDNGESEEVTDIFKDYYFIDKKHVDDMCDGCKFELIMSTEQYQQFPMYETPRDATAAMLKKGTIASHGTLIPLRELVGNRQYVSRPLKDISLQTTLNDYDGIQKFIKEILDNGATFEFYEYTFKCDGVVVSVLRDDESIFAEVAIKIIHDVHEAKLLDIEYQLGNTGKITPVAKITPTLFADGKRTVSSITLSTLDRVQKMTLRRNDTVSVMYNIVPYLIDSKHDGDVPLPIPTKCPICGHKLDLSHLETVRCMNPDCTGRKIGDITRYVIKMRMLGIAKSTVERLYEAGLVTCISDLYKLTKEDIMSVDGYKEKSADNIIRIINNSSQDCPVSRWLGALPFKDVDAKKWELILNGFFGNDEMKKSNGIRMYVDSNSNKFIEEVLTGYYEGVGDITIRVINEGWMRNIEEMRKIIKHISFRITTSVSNPGVPITTYVTFTGCRDEELVEWLLNKGVATIDFGSKTEYLIIPNKDYQNNKTAKAKSKGLYILPIGEVKDFFEPF